MFGLTFEKLLVVLLIATVLLGPTRLPAYTRRFAAFVRALRSHVDAANARIETETGVSAAQWRALDPRQYDPRTIIREALEVSPTPGDAAVSAPSSAERPVSGPPTEPELPAPALAVQLSDEELLRIRPGQRYLVIGGSAHPVRIAIDELPDGHPARLAAQPVREPDEAITASASESGSATAHAASQAPVLSTSDT